MSLPPFLTLRMRLPVIAAPMFLVSTPDLVIAQCRAGVIGSFAALSARTSEDLAAWLDRIKTELAQYDALNPDRPSAPFAVNLVVHHTNARLERDLDICFERGVCLLLTSLGAKAEIYRRAQDAGAAIFHDVTTTEHGRKAMDRGANGLIAVAAGAGGHGGQLSPFALVSEIRSFHDGPLVLAGAIATGSGILAAQAMGADAAYIGSAFIAAQESGAVLAYKEMIANSRAADIIYTDRFSGIHANYLAPSIQAAGLDPARLDELERRSTSFASGGAKAWRDIWGAGQGIGAIAEVTSAEALICRLDREYREALGRLYNQGAAK